MSKMNEEKLKKFEAKIDEIFKNDENGDKKLDVEEILNYETNGQVLEETELDDLRDSIKKFISNCNLDGDNKISKQELLENYKFNLS